MNSVAWQILPWLLWAALGIAWNSAQNTRKLFYSRLLIEEPETWSNLVISDRPERENSQRVGEFLSKCDYKELHNPEIVRLGNKARTWHICFSFVCSALFTYYLATFLSRFVPA